MGYRSERDESHFTNAEMLAWEFVLPYRYVPILDSDTHSAEKLVIFLQSKFSRQALKLAANKDSK